MSGEFQENGGEDLTSLPPKTESISDGEEKRQDSNDNESEVILPDTTQKPVMQSTQENITSATSTKEKPQSIKSKKENDDSTSVESLKNSDSVTSSVVQKPNTTPLQERDAADIQDVPLADNFDEEFGSWEASFPPISESFHDNSDLPLDHNDLELCQKLDLAYERSIDSLNVLLKAKYASIRQSAFYSLLFFAIYLFTGTTFYAYSTTWKLNESLLFSIYTVTTVGFGNHEIPDTESFKLFTIFYILIGIAALVTVLAQIYTWLVLEAARAQFSRDKATIARKGQEMLSSSQHNGNDHQSEGSLRQSVRFVMEYSDMTTENRNVIERAMDSIVLYFERFKAFLRETQVGRIMSVVFPLIFLILFGAAVVGAIEGWTFLESVYWAVVSLTTVGFGDYYPTKDASIWFCVFYLPFSACFMSIFLSSIAKFYIQLNNINIQRLERHMKRKLFRQRRERDLRSQRELAARMETSKRSEAARTDGSAGETTSKVGKSEGLDSSHDQRGNETAAQEPTIVVQQNLPAGYDTLAIGDDEEDLYGNSVFGTSELNSNKHYGMIRREKVLMRSSLASSSKSQFSRETVSNLKSMSVVLDRITNQIHQSFGHSDMTIINYSDLDNLFNNGGENKNRSTEADDADMSDQNAPSLRNTISSLFTRKKSEIRKASFALRVLVQERIAHIIANDVAGFHSDMQIQDDSLSVTIETLRLIADKWMLPLKAQKAFRSVAFEALFFVGERALIVHGADALFELSPLEFHGLFGPLLAAMGDAETMEAWLASSNILAECEFKKILGDEEYDGRPSPTSPQVATRHSLSESPNAFEIV